MSLSLGEVIDQLRSAPASAVPLLEALHLAVPTLGSVPRAQLAHLTGRTLALTRSGDTRAVWCGVNIVHVLAASTPVVSAEGTALLALLVAVLGSRHADDPAVLESAAAAVARLCAGLRGKPTLTREVLTPSLDAVVAALAARAALGLGAVLGALRTLVLEHPTTARPHANRLRAQLLALAMDDGFVARPVRQRAAVCRAVACLHAVEKDEPAQHWLRDVAALLAELAATAEIYASFLRVEDDPDAAALLRTLAPAGHEPLFTPLRVDVNAPATIRAVAHRVQVLFELLAGYVLSGTRHAVAVPLGRVLAAVDLVCALNPRLVTFRRELRDLATRLAVEASLHHCHAAALALLEQLPAQYSALLVPHVPAVLATVELLVPLSHKRVDRARLLGLETVVCAAIRCADAYVCLVNYYADHALLARLLEAAVALMQPRAGASLVAEPAPLGRHGGGRKKGRRSAAVPLSDLLSHEHLFAPSIPAPTREAVLSLFACVIRRVPISPTHYNRILKLVLVEAVLQARAAKHGCVDPALEAVLIAALLHPAPESASIFSLAAALLPHSDTLGVLNSPRFPPMPVLARNSVNADDEEEDDADDADGARDDVRERPAAEGENEPAAKRLRPAQSPRKDNPPSTPADIFTSKPQMSLGADNDEASAIAPVGETHNQALVPGLIDDNLDAVAVLENASRKIPALAPESVQQAGSDTADEMDSDGGSEIEIPDLDLDDSDEEK